MDALSPNKNSKQSSSSSSGCSASSSTTDIKNSYKSQRLDNKSTGMRSKSFLHCLSKHLARHFTLQSQRHHHQHSKQHKGETIVYNSQEDLRSSSTDSFSLSYDRNTRLNSLNQTGTATSSFDMSGSEERTSRTSSTSACLRFPPEQNDMENAANYSESDSGNSSSNENEDVENNENVFNQTTGNSKSSPANTNGNSLRTSSSKGLHLSRISITSSVKSIFQHISSVSASSTRSLSCSSTPLKRVWDTKCKKSQPTPSTSATANAKSNKSSKSSTTVTNTRSASTSSSTTSNKKTEKKQQSILRPPMNYVYTKGMSGLYSRVPRYSVSCPYNTQQWA